MYSGRHIGSHAINQNIKSVDAMPSKLASRLPPQLWQLSLQYLPVLDIISRIPLINHFFNDQVVWSKSSTHLLFTGVSREPTPLSNPMLDNGVVMTGAIKRAPVAHLRQLFDSDVISKNDINMDVFGGTLLHWSVERPAVTALLLRYNADPNAIGEYTGLPPLFDAIRNGGTVKTVELLLNAKAMIHRPDHHASATFEASGYADMNTMEVLFARDPRPDEPCSHGHTIRARISAYRNGRDRRYLLRLLDEANHRVRLQNASTSNPVDTP